MGAGGPTPAERWRCLLASAVWLLEHQFASPASLLAYWGVIQWFDLLDRQKFSMYHHIHPSIAGWDDRRDRELPQNIPLEVGFALLFSTNGWLACVFAICPSLPPLMLPPIWALALALQNSMGVTCEMSPALLNLADPMPALQIRIREQFQHS